MCWFIWLKLRSIILQRSGTNGFFKLVIIILLYYYYVNQYYYNYYVSCHRPILPGNSLEPTVIPTAQASSFTLQYFPYYV
jgi:hypothetical protein